MLSQFLLALLFVLPALPHAPPGRRVNLQQRQPPWAFLAMVSSKQSLVSSSHVPWPEITIEAFWKSPG